MNKLALGFLLGAAVAALVLWPVLKHERRLSWDYGRKAGIIQGHFDAADALQKEFGFCPSNLTGKVLLSVKTTLVVSVETNGVKTVRVVP
jgi:hypothetical protein